MTLARREIIAVSLTILGLAVVTVGPFYYQSARLPPEEPSGHLEQVVYQWPRWATAYRWVKPKGDRVDRVITLTGYGEQGVWTRQSVNGMNYWNQDFENAHPVVHVGETVLIRLTSADVVHGFNLPQLGIQKLQIYPGRVTQVKIHPEKPGEYFFFCSVVCGDHHDNMHGKLVVKQQDQ